MFGRACLCIRTGYAECGHDLLLNVHGKYGLLMLCQQEVCCSYCAKSGNDEQVC